MKPAISHKKPQDRIINWHRRDELMTALPLAISSLSRGFLAPAG
jgi:hypothetical protein